MPHNLVANAAQLCGECRTTLWRMPHNFVANATQPCGECQELPRRYFFGAGNIYFLFWLLSLWRLSAGDPHKIVMAKKNKHSYRSKI